MRKTPSKRKSSEPPRKTLQRIPPHRQEARDEGPRLLPWDNRGQEPSHVDYLVDLADIALGKKKRQKRGPTDQ